MTADARGASFHADWAIPPSMAYAALDYYGIDELFTHEERMVRDTVRELVTSRVMPTIG